MKLTLLIISIVTIVFGWIAQSSIVAIVGAIIYILILLVGLIPVIRSSRRYRDNLIKVVDKEEEKTINKKSISILEGVMTCLGLFAAVSGVESIETAGWIIWIGTIIVYFTSGVIVNIITGIPLKFGYGGWYVPRTKKRFR